MSLVPLTLESVLPSLAGGVLIGLSASLLLLGTGRIAGISGIFGNVLTGRPVGVSLCFFIGLLVSPWLVRLARPLELGQNLSGASLLALGGTGLLVGIGTQLGSGCTSGHGVCGLANLSPRSLVAVLTFIGIAMLVVGLGFGV
jgi:uncharacterized membrane protein YedE/YeeE